MILVRLVFRPANSRLFSESLPVFETKLSVGMLYYVK